MTYVKLFIVQHQFSVESTCTLSEFLRWGFAKYYGTNVDEETSRRYFKLRKCVFSDIREKKKGAT